MQNLVQQWHWEVLAHSPYSLDLTPCDYWLFACVKEHLWTKQFESEDGIKIAVTVSLHHLCKYEYTHSDCLPHGWKKYVHSAGDSTLSRGNIHKHSGIPSVII